MPSPVFVVRKFPVLLHQRGRPTFRETRKAVSTWIVPRSPCGNAYATIAEAKLPEILEPIAPPGTRKKNIGCELTHIVKYSKEFSYTMKPHMHSAITSEAQSLLLDA